MLKFRQKVYLVDIEVSFGTTPYKARSSICIQPGPIHLDRSLLLAFESLNSRWWFSDGTTCNIQEVPINSFVVVVTNLLGETSSDWPWVITTPSSLGLLKLSTSWNVGIFQLLYDSFCCKGSKINDISQWAHKNKRKSVR